MLYIIEEINFCGVPYKYADIFPYKMIFTERIASDKFSKYSGRFMTAQKFHKRLSHMFSMFELGLES